jgi:hypothetical protein
MSEGPDDAVQQEKEMREHEREARERAAGEGGRDPGEDPNSTTPATIQTGNVSGS